MALRDIRDDLKERLRIALKEAEAISAEFEKEAKALQERYRLSLAAAERDQELLAQLLENENRRLGVTAQEAAPTAPTMPLDDFFVQQVQTKSPRSKDDLKEAAIKAGYFPDVTTAGRATHTTLLNITRANRIRNLGNDNYGMIDIFAAGRPIAGGTLTITDEYGTHQQ